VCVIGRIDEKTRDLYLAAADLAVNPMFAGSGTNIKMFDFMAAGLPIVSTPIGARGIDGEDELAFVVRPPQEMASGIRALVDDPRYAATVGSAARRLAEQAYSWERVSRQLGLRLHRVRARLGRPSPFFSVIVASYERQDSLRDLLRHLTAQTWRDFEVIIVDQSRDEWHGWKEFDDLDVLYLHTDVKGAVGARNTAAWHAQGDVLAFTDDDCQPLPDWLANARPYFDDPGTVGVEGFILSDKRDDPNWRAVTNVNFEGIGFMTANLLLRRETFMAIDGFDGRFDHPHFREDTDLGWRALNLGRIPFGQDVRVFHPPQRRDSDREGLAERVRYFEKDALLMSKHPERYRRLFLYESHYRQTAGFREHFLRGAAKYQVKVDDFYRSLLSTDPIGATLEEVSILATSGQAAGIGPCPATTPEDVLT
jgi:glycosyltransferase involved in cell wall biosynthesis